MADQNIQQKPFEEREIFHHNERDERIVTETNVVHVKVEIKLKKMIAIEDVPQFVEDLKMKGELTKDNIIHSADIYDALYDY